MMSYLGSLVLIGVIFSSSPKLVYLDGRIYFIYSTLAWTVIRSQAQPLLLDLNLGLHCILASHCSGNEDSHTGPRLDYISTVVCIVVPIVLGNITGILL